MNCLDCNKEGEEWDELTDQLCNYHYKKSQVLVHGDEIAEVCRKCSRGYKYTWDEINSGKIGQDICRDCVAIREAFPVGAFSKEELRVMLMKLSN